MTRLQYGGIRIGKRYATPPMLLARRAKLRLIILMENFGRRVCSSTIVDRLLTLAAHPTSPPTCLLMRL